MRRVALVTGVTGQDGAYLSKLLLEKDYTVYGLVRRSTRYALANLDYLGVTSDLDLIEGDLGDEASLINVVRRTHPNEVYNLAAQSFVGSSWDQPILTTDVDAMGTLRLLEAVRHFAPQARFYQASTSEMFGNSHENGLQTEETPFHPRSPYAIAKLYAYWIVNNYRDSYGMFCVNGILFNHESPIRGPEFVTRKISRSVAQIKLGLSQRLGLGNLHSRRDWGFAGDYVEAMRLMLQQDAPENFIISTGETHSVRDFVQAAFEHVGIPDWEARVYIDPAFRRPAELFCLQGSSRKAREKLGWQPRVRFRELVAMMVDADLQRLRQGAA
ncbi:MAG: GDP-mannose 4,6-dehydratase [Armatimonadetes bacterium]|nr:GDP-mannose 4,6-dehydratase [Armatimonadota bacterium]